VLVDTGDAVTVDGAQVPRSTLAYAGPGRSSITLATPEHSDARLLLLGGAPFGEDILMWWNFVGRTHDEVVAARDQWQAGLTGAGERFGRVEGYDGPPLPAPDLPNVRLVPRSKR
jgi:redox-sensitive bicupin YhaK (pirin superfamily)